MTETQCGGDEIQSKPVLFSVVWLFFGIVRGGCWHVRSVCKHANEQTSSLTLMHSVCSLPLDSVRLLGGHKSSIYQ